MMRCLLVLLIVLSTITAYAQDAAPTPKYAVIDFGATWCGPCRQLKPILESKEVRQLLADRQMDFYEVDIDKYREYAKLYGVRSVPTVIMVQLDYNGDGTEVKRFVGLQNKQWVLKWLSD